MYTTVIKHCLLEDLLYKKGWTQAYLSEITGINKTQINLYVTKKRIMSLPIAYTIAKTLDCQIEDLYVFERIKLSHPL